MSELRITNDYIKSLNPCENRYNNYVSHYKNTSFSISDFLRLEHISYNDKIWAWKKFTTKKEAVYFSLCCAESVLHIFEEQNSKDKRPRLALEAVRDYLVNPSEVTKQRCKEAANEAYDAYNHYSGYPGYVAYAAAYAAYTVAYDVTCSFVDAITKAAANNNTDYTIQQDLNLLYLISIYEGSNT